MIAQKRSDRIWLLRRRYSAVGGAERFTLRLASALSQKGYEVWIAAEYWPDSEDKSYRVKKISSHTATGYAKACLQTINHSKDDLIFSLERTLCQQIFRAGDGVHACWLERRKSYLPFLHRTWSSWDHKHRAILKLEKEVFNPNHTDCVIANSQMVKREIIEHFSFPEERIKIIHPGVNLEIFKPILNANDRFKLRHQAGLPKEAIVWCFVGSDFIRKGLEWAIRIAAAQKEKIWLLVLGKGNHKPFIRIAESVGFASRLRFIDLSTAAVQIYQTSDAMILPTIYDPCSNACLEAAACGLPVMTTEANGASEYIKCITFKDPRQVDECAQRCVPYAQLLQPLPLDQVSQLKLDEKICWEALFRLIGE